MKIFILFILACCLVRQGNAQSSDISTIILVRHAEKSREGGKNPHLSEEGKQRAERLAFFLKDVTIDAVYASRSKRARETLAVISKAKGLILKDYSLDNPQEVYNMISYGIGKTILIAGDSNTVPTLVNVLIHQKAYSYIPENDYGSLWILLLKGHEIINCSLYHY